MGSHGAFFYNIRPVFMTMLTKSRLCLSALLALTLCQCSGITKEADNYPIDPNDERAARAGKMTGEGGLTIFGGDGGGSDSSTAVSSIAVNSYLWRATLDTLDFMPLKSTDPFGGVILTDWYENPESPGERFKVDAVILSPELRADALKISLFRQTREGTEWKNTGPSAGLAREMENIILSRARELRLNAKE